MMKKFILIPSLSFLLSLNAQSLVHLQGDGYLVQGVEQFKHQSFSSTYFLILPVTYSEQSFWDSLFKEICINSKSHYLYIRNNDSTFGNMYESVLKFPVLIHKGLSSKDSLFKANNLKYDINNCYMRSNRPFSSMVSLDSMYNFKYIVHFDKIKFKGQLIKLPSIIDYKKLMSYVFQDKVGKLSVLTKGKVILTELSAEYQKWENNFLVVILQELKTYDNRYSKSDPDCFIEE